MKVVVFIVSLVIFLVSLYCFPLAFLVEDLVFIVPGGLSIGLFIAGIVGVGIAFAIPFHLLKTEQR